MRMRLRLVFDEAFCESEAVQHLERRLYVVQTLILPGLAPLFRQRAVYVNAHSTAAIEGNPLSAAEAMRVSVEGADADKPAEVEVANIEVAYELIEQLAGDATVAIDQGLIRALNSIVLRGLPGPPAQARGRYRLGPSAVVAEGTRRILYLPPPPERVPELMKGLVEEIEGWRTRYPSAVTAALAHFGLVSIHPFEDGNGRTARLIAEMLLRRKGRTVEGMLTVNEAILAERERYYAVLQETQGEEFRETVEVDAFLQFHTEALGRTAQSLEDRAVLLARLRDITIETGGGLYNERQATALMSVALLDRPISSSMYAKLARAAQTTAVADLNQLVAKGFFEKVGQGKNTRYRLHQDFARRLAESE